MCVFRVFGLTGSSFVVYFDHCTGALQAFCWLKSSFQGIISKFLLSIVVVLRLIVSNILNVIRHYLEQNRLKVKILIKKKYFPKNRPAFVCQPAFRSST